MVKKHLCSSCNLEFPTCPAKNIVFGCDAGGKSTDDNVVECDSYQAKTEE